MVAYRAETAMAEIVRENLSRDDDARSLLRDLYRTEADIIPVPESHELQVRVHTMANPRMNRAVIHLLNELNDASHTYAGTKWKLVYSLIGNNQK